ncbi:NADH:flavin oxidoreductase/NADH oxidase [Colletotrichum cereale]|nr:NADH:flavin oxidoreductase/NADH oxidase [Colletotrichum cereale]
MPKATTPPPAFAALKDTALFTPLKLGNLSLKHRIVQAPTTRMRSEFESRGVYVPGARVAKYYGERASDGGLQISEATDICLDASAYPGVAGVFTDSQLQGWRKVTDAVHSKGGFIFVQLWHTGRASSAGMRGGNTPVSSSSQPMDGKYLDGTECKDGPPRPLTVDEIHDLTAEWSAASKRAVEVAGFDGVEIHGANGYLMEQFLHDNINDRTDEYGGSIENRSRFLLEVVSAVSAAIGPEKVGLRLSPYNYFQGTRDSDPNKHWSYISQRLAELPGSQRPVYVHMIEPRFDEVLDEEQKLASLSGSKPEAKQTNSLTQFKDILKPAGIHFFAAGNFDRDNALVKVKSGKSDAVVFGRYFIANPDLVERLRNGWPLNPYDRTTFYGAEPPEKGYNDYEFYKIDNAKVAAGA